jgi:phosphoribosylaminoimidazole carboxylase (NCAIR synthetase)
VQQLVGIASAYRQEFCSTAEVEAEVRAVLGVPVPEFEQEKERVLKSIGRKTP